MRFKATDYISQFLYAQGVTTVFQVIGGMTTHLVDSLYVQGNIRIVDVHHEQAAAFAADGAARVTGVPGIALATSGPGATNLITGIGSCYFDSTPAVFITGQVNRHELKGNRAIRQLGFQETDIVSMVGPVTKAAWAVTSAEQLPDLLAKAFEIALSGRPGPVLLDIPFDVQQAQIETESPSRLPSADAVDVDGAVVHQLLQAFKSAKRPIILAGGGVRTAQATDAFRAFVNTTGVPVVHSLMGVDLLPYRHPLRVGMIGSYGNRWANQAIGKADLLLVLGSRLDIRQTGAQTDAFKGDRPIFHVDCEPGELNNRIQGCITLQADLKDFLSGAIRQAKTERFPDYAAWRSEIAEARAAWRDTNELPGISGINPNAVIHEIARASQAAAAFVIDVGQHQMWASQSIEMTETQRFLTSGGMGAMGFALN